MTVLYLFVGQYIDVGLALFAELELQEELPHEIAMTPMDHWPIWALLGLAPGLLACLHSF